MPVTLGSGSTSQKRARAAMPPGGVTVTSACHHPALGSATVPVKSAVAESGTI